MSKHILSFVAGIVTGTQFVRYAEPATKFSLTYVDENIHPIGLMYDYKVHDYGLFSLVNYAYDHHDGPLQKKMFFTFRRII